MADYHFTIPETDVVATGPDIPPGGEPYDDTELREKDAALEEAILSEVWARAIADVNRPIIRKWNGTSWQTVQNATIFVGEADPTAIMGENDIWVREFE